MMPSRLPELLELLELEPIDPGILRGTAPATTLQRVFGGQVLGQALMAAGSTVTPDRQPHSLHGYFLRPGDPTARIVYVVETTRDGRAFSTRRVIARQRGRPIFHMTASFQVVESGFDHQDPMPTAPEPEGLRSLKEQLSDVSAGPSPDEWDAIDVRYVDSSDPSRYAVWLRTNGLMPDVRLMHCAVLAYASDLTLLAAAGAHHGLSMSDPRAFTASLDHAMWFHREVRVDDWLLHDQESPSASGARALGRGRIFDRTGQLVATTVQEGLLRPSR
jgi:acyl-CoA thioesterase-2